MSDTNNLVRFFRWFLHLDKPASAAANERSPSRGYGGSSPLGRNDSGVGGSVGGATPDGKGEEVSGEQSQRAWSHDIPVIVVIEPNRPAWYRRPRSSFVMTEEEVAEKLERDRRFMTCHVQWHRVKK